MNRLILILLSITLANCQNEKKLIDFKLNQIGAIISLPNTYKGVDNNSIKRFINIKDSIFEYELIAYMNKNQNDVVLIDTINPYKFVLISTIDPYINIDSVTFFLLIDKERSNSCSEPKADSTYYIGSKIGIIDKYKYIESKYLRYDKMKRQRIGYSFIISSSTNTVGIGFFSPEEQDVKQYISLIRKDNAY